MRMYRATFEKVAVSAVQDLLTLIQNPPAGGGSALTKIFRLWLMCVDNTPPTAQILTLRARLLAAGLTVGSGGTTPTATKVDAGDAASVAVLHANDTTKTSTTGTVYVQWEGGFYLYQGFDLIFSAPPLLVPGQGFVFELITTPGAAITLSGGIEWGEEGLQV